MTVSETMAINAFFRRWGLVVLLILHITSAQGVTFYSVNGRINGLAEDGGPLILILNDGLGEIQVSSNGRFTFPQRLPDGFSYHVKVNNTRMVPGQSCEVVNGAGSINAADIDNVEINCATPLANPLCRSAMGEWNALVSGVAFISGSSRTYCKPRGRLRMVGEVAIDNATVLTIEAVDVAVRGTLTVASGSELRIKKRVPVNDTGITFCGNFVTNSYLCTQSGLPDFPDQDGQHGRDKYEYHREDGYAGFSFTKIDADGNYLTDSAVAWSCVQDNVTGLTWETKTVDRSLRNKEHTYTWYNPDSDINGGNAGVQDGGSCNGSVCDTRGYVEAINDLGLCGFRDWRMPSIWELLSILVLDRNRSSVLDTDYFPNGSTREYWTGSAYVGNSSNAWGIGFYSGGAFFSDKGRDYRVRLVRGGR